MEKIEINFPIVKRKILLLFCVLATFIIFFPFSIKNTYAAKTRYAYASITMNGATSTIGVRYGDNPSIWVVSGANNHNITITGKNNATTSVSSGISPVGKKNNWNYAKVSLTIPKGWYFPSGTSWSNFENGGTSAVQFTTPGGVTGYVGNGLPTSPVTYDSRCDCTIYWLNTATSPSTNGNASYKYWNFRRDSYTVNFHNASGAVYNTQTVLYGDAAYDPTHPTATGHTFAGWNVGFGCITGNLDVYPTWSVNSYYLDVNGRLDGSDVGNTDGYGTFDVYVNNQLVANDVTDFYRAITYGSTYSITDIRATSGHTYERVYSGSASGTMGAGNTGVSLQFRTDTILDLNGWLDGNSNGGIGGYGTADIYINGRLVASNVSDYCTSHPYGSTYRIVPHANTGHTYNGVHSGSLTGTIYKDRINVSLDYSTDKYTYTFVYGNGASNSTLTKTYGVACKLPAAPTRNGYKFLNWKSGTSNATYAAQWQALDYYIRYNGNGAEKGSMDRATATVSVEKTLDLCRFGRAGYTFLGWSKSANATTATYTDEAKVKDLTTTGNATVDLYAVWKKEASPEINMFTGCFKVSGEAGTKYDRRYVNHKRANIDKSGDPGYFTKK